MNTSYGGGERVGVLTLGQFSQHDLTDKALGNFILTGEAKNKANGGLHSHCIGSFANDKEVLIFDSLGFNITVNEPKQYTYLLPNLPANYSYNVIKTTPSNLQAMNSGACSMFTTAFINFMLQNSEWDFNKFKTEYNLNSEPELNDEEISVWFANFAKNLKVFNYNDEEKNTTEHGGKGAETAEEKT
jgi:hypothetical protein